MQPARAGIKKLTLNPAIVTKRQNLFLRIVPSLRVSGNDYPLNLGMPIRE
jgi:hypothetical protein